jgi:hypothetical protein
LKLQKTAKPIDYFLFFGLAFLAAVFSISFYRPRDSHFPIHDFLDHFFVIEAVRGEKFQFFDLSASISTILGGISLNAFNFNDLGLDHLIYQIFSPFTAVVLVELVSRVVGYIAFYFAAKKIFKRFRFVNQVALAGALTYSLLPYWPSVALTVACVPVAVLLFLEINGNYSKKRIVVLILFLSQNMNFTYGGFVLVALLFANIAILSLKGRKKLWWAFCLLIIGFLIANVRIAKLLIVDDFQPHRREWPQPTHGWFDSFYFGGFLDSFKEYFKSGQYHFGAGQVGINNTLSVQVFLITCSGIILIVQTLFKKLRSDSYLQLRKMYTAGIGVWLIVGTFYASETSGLTQVQSLLKASFQFSRIVVLTPIIITMLSCVSILILIHFKYIPFKTSSIVLISFVMVAQTAVTYFPLNNKVRTIQGGEASLSLAEYFQIDEYRKIEKIISREKSSYSVLSYGLDPMVASFNGFQALDGYTFNYDSRYKAKFYEIIRDEIKDTSYEGYFNTWGSRVYLFAAGPRKENPNFNWCAGFNMGARYVLSGIQLDYNKHLNPIDLTKNIYIYRIESCASN